MVNLEVMKNLSFESPHILWFLFLAIVPLILHLISIKRYKTYFFSNVGVLKEIKQESNSIRKIRDWLLMLLRMFLIVLLVLLFAEPKTVTGEVESGSKAIFIDNSLSMSLSAGNVSKIEEAKRQAISFLKSLSFDEKVFITSSSEVPIKSNLLYRDQAIEQVKNMVVSSKTFGIHDALINKGFNEVYVFSDFQATQFDLGILDKDTITEFHLIETRGDELCNAFPDSVWLDKKDVEGDRVRLKLGYTLSSNCKAKFNLRLLNGNSLIAAKEEVLMEKNSFIDFELPNDSLYKLSLQVKDEEVDYDNNLDFVLDLTKRGEVLLFNNEFEEESVKSLLGDKVAFVEGNKLTLNSIKKASIILLPLNRLKEEETPLYKNFIESGGLVMVYPSTVDDYSRLNKLLQKATEVDELSNGIIESYPDNLFFKGVFEKSKKNIKISQESLDKYFKTSHNSLETLVSTTSGIPLLQRKYMKDGQLLLLNTTVDDIKNTNFLPLLILKLFENQTNHKHLYYRKGSRQWLGFSKRPQILKFLSDSSSLKVSDFKVAVDDNRLKTGFVKLDSPEGEKRIIAINSNKIESSLEFKLSIDVQTPNIKVYEVLTDKGYLLSGEEKSFTVYILLIIISLTVVEMTVFALKK